MFWLGVFIFLNSYLQDCESSPISISFAKNGEHLGECFSIEPAELGDGALIPHILTKNTEFEINFGQNVSYDFNVLNMVYYLFGDKIALLT